MQEKKSLIDTTNISINDFDIEFLDTDNELTKKIDTQILLQVLFNAVKENGDLEENIELELNTVCNMGKNRELANQTYYIESHNAITSHRKVIGKLIIFIKKIIRKALKWYIDPIVNQQNTFNENVVKTLNEMDESLSFIRDREQKIESKYVTQYTQQIVKLEQQLQEIINNVEISLEDIRSNFREIDNNINENRNSISEINNSINENRNSISEINNSINENRNSINEILSMKEEIHEREIQINNSISEVIMQIKNVETRLHEFGMNLRSNNEQLANHHNRLNMSFDGISKLNEHVSKLNQEQYKNNTFIHSRFRRLESKVKVEERLDNRSMINQEGIVNKKIDIDYYLFEEKYRGEEAEIKKRLQEYLPYFDKKENVLDIGCGRGEFLEVLRENNIKSKGIELDDDMISICNHKGLDVEKADALSYLESLKDSSLGGIILTQVIEHLDPNDMIKLIQLAYRKLQKGAYLIMETINPRSLIVYTEAYFMDLSHIRMIHPFTLQFLLDYEEFEDVKICYMSKVEDSARIPEVESLPQEFNSGIRRLNDLVFGYRDFAAIARK